MPISPNSVTFVPVGCLFMLKSGFFVGKTITTIGTPWMFNKHFKGILQFTLAPSSVSESFRIIVGARGCDNEVQFTFYPIPESNTLYAYSVDMESTSSQSYRLTISENKEYTTLQKNVPESNMGKKELKEKHNPQWTVDAINAKTGVKTLESEVSSSTFTMDTSHWVPGVYVIRAFTGGDVIFAKKIIVK